ncbi:hypothetical protein K1T71_006357 [Dendrolimus kikuchii]|uniref:Uncharacterized protein n=1 Tax=Dendrolimus kikuchii TaxID=765133 RepID=A0ACC1D3K8_9NEOP|nr:hypothetical protein K1T71_006357 [Dendrolimus kikuchii]
MKVLTTFLEVRLEHKIIEIPFLIFPDATNNETLLGIDFLTAAKVCVDFHTKIWFFSDVNKLKYNLSFEPITRSVPCSSVEVLRDDEGSHLNPAERQALADVLTRNARVFNAGGGPTPYAEHHIDTVQKVSPTTFVVATTANSVLGKYHVQDLTRYQGNKLTPPKPVNPKRNRGRPAKADEDDRILVQERGRIPGLEGEHIVTRAGRCIKRPNRFVEHEGEG